MDFLDRIRTRAAKLPGAGAGLGNSKPGTGYTGSNMISTSSAGGGGGGGSKRKAPLAGTRSITYNSPGQPQNLDIASDQLALENYLASVYVMRCVRTIAETLAALPFVAGPDPFDPGNYNLDAPLARLLGPATPAAPGGPQPHMSSRAFWIWTVVQYLISGRFCWEKLWDGKPGKSNIISLWPLPSAAVSPIPIDGKTEIWAAFQYQTPTGIIQLPREDVLYAWRASAADWRMPETVLQSAALPIYMQRAVDKYITSLLNNNMVATTMIVAPPFEEPDHRRSWEDQFQAQFTGVDRAGGTIFGYVEADEDDPTGKPLVQVEKLAQTPVEASLTQVSVTAKNDICCVPGTGIVTKRGVVPIEKVQVGDEVVTHRGRWRKVEATMARVPTQPVLEMRAQGLEPLRLTANHNVRAARYTKTHADTSYQYQGTEWVPAGELRARGRQRRDSHALTVTTLTFPQETGTVDLTSFHELGRRGKFTLAVREGMLGVNKSNSHPVPAVVKLSPALGRLLGLYLAEGSIGRHGTQVVWSLHEDETDLAKQISDDVMEVFGLSVFVRQAAEGRCVNVTMSSALVAPLFKCGTARTKTVPEWAWAGDRAFMTEVLWGWMAGDGSNDGRHVRGFTSSEGLAWHMRLVAIALGHRAGLTSTVQTPSVIYGREIAGGGKGWTVSWLVNEDVPRTIYRLEDEALTSPLRTVEPIDHDGLVYNLSVEEDHSYLTTGGAVKNCIALGVPRSLIGDASQRTYANANSEYRSFWTLTMLNIIAEIQEHVNLRLAPQIGAEVGWFDLSRVEAVRPPAIFAPPDVAEAINVGILSAEQAGNLLGIPPPDDQGDSDVETAMIGEESSTPSPMGGGRAAFYRQMIHTRGWVPAVGPQLALNVDVIRNPQMRTMPKPKRQPIRLRSLPAGPPSTAGYDEAQRLCDRVANLRALAAATRKASKVHKYLATNYPQSTLGWVDGAEWSGPQDIDLDDIKMARRPGGRDQGKVQGIANSLADDPEGPAGAPVVLVRVPDGSLEVADGYHRLLAHKRLDHKTVPAYVGKVDDAAGPWQKEMHDKKLNRELSVSTVHGGWQPFAADDEVFLRMGDESQWYGVGAIAAPGPPTDVNAKKVSETVIPYQIEDEDPYNGVPSEHIEQIGDLLAVGGPNRDED